jgi:hypothetical protein
MGSLFFQRFNARTKYEPTNPLAPITRTFIPYTLFKSQSPAPDSDSHFAYLFKMENKSKSYL